LYIITHALQDGFEPLQHRGALRVLSPIEFALAAVQACYRDVQKKLPDNDMRKWKRAFQNVQFDFVKVPEAKTSLFAFHLREMLLEQGESVGWSTLQRVQMIIREKHNLVLKTGKDVSSSTLSKHFQGNKTARGQDDISPAFIDSALTIENRILKDDVAASVLSKVDRTHGLKGPFDSVYKLQTIINKCKSTTNIRWALTALVDMLDMDQITAGDFAVRKLETALCPLVMLKLQFRDHLLTTFLDSRPFNPVAKSKIREVFASHDAVRKHVTPYPGSAKPGLTWQAALPPSTQRLVELIENIVFLDTFDGTLKQGIKYGKSVDDVIEYNLIQEEVQDVLNCLQKEMQTDAQDKKIEIAGVALPPSSQDAKDIIMADNKDDHAKEFKEYNEKLNKMSDDDRVHWTDVAERTVRQYARIIVHPASEKQLLQDMRLRRYRLGMLL
jgi:hypothetical protein